MTDKTRTTTPPQPQDAPRALEIVPAQPPGSRRRRDERVRRIARKLRRLTPSINNPAFEPAINRLARASVIEAELYQRIRAEGFEDLQRIEAWRRLVGTIAKLEDGLAISPAARIAAIPVANLAQAFASIVDQRAADRALPPPE